MAWSHDCIEGWNVYFLFEESFPFKLFNRTTIENLLYKPKKVNKTPLIVTPKKSFVSQSQHLFSARGMSSTRAGLPRYIKTPVIPNWISPHVDSTVQQAAVFGPHIGILLDSFALLLLSMHCSASLHKSESKSEAKRMSHCSPSLIWSRGAYACWWMLVGEVLGTSGWSGLEASKPGSSVPADDGSIACLDREEGTEQLEAVHDPPLRLLLHTLACTAEPCIYAHCTLLRLLQTMLWRQHHKKFKNTLLVALLD